MKHLFIYLFIYLSSLAHSQEMIIDWGVCFGGSNTWSIAKTIEILPNESLVISITINENNDAYTNYHGGGDSWVLILDNAGNIINDRCFWGGGEVIYFRTSKYMTIIYTL